MLDLSVDRAIKAKADFAVVGTVIASAASIGRAMLNEDEEEAENY